jgi:hypothetical protein
MQILKIQNEYICLIKASIDVVFDLNADAMLSISSMDSGICKVDFRQKLHRL